MTVDPGIGKNPNPMYPWTNYVTEVPYQTGTWTVSPNSGYQTLFSQTCVTHANSELKPLSSTFWVTLPNVPTVYIRLVFKIGEQNNGWMVYPPLLTLQQGFSASSTKLPNIALAVPGTNCHQACTASYPTTTPACDPVNSASITSLSILEQLLPNQVTQCKPGATISTCSANNPMLNDTAGGMCSFNSACTPSSTPAFSCEAADANNHRICWCTSGGSELTSTPSSSPLPPSSSPTSTPHSTGSSAASSFPTVPVAVSVSIGSVAIFAIFIGYGLFRRQQFANTSKMTSDVNMQPMVQQVARPVMPDGRI